MLRGAGEQGEPGIRQIFRNFELLLATLLVEAGGFHRRAIRTSVEVLKTIFISGTLSSTSRWLGTIKKSAKIFTKIVLENT